MLTAWPATDELTHPELGYVKHPWTVWPIDDFTSAQISRAAAEECKYSAALVFATKYDPPPILNIWPFTVGMDERYFGLHKDLQPRAIARRLGGTVAWRMNDDDMWIAVIEFPRPRVASLQPK